MIIYRLSFDNDIKKQFVYVQDNATMIKEMKAGLKPSDAFKSNGEKKVGNWNPPAICWFNGDGRNLDKYKDPDISFIDGADHLIFNPTATKLIKPAVKDVAELLPVPFNNQTWSFLNVFNHIDAFDEENSKFEIYDDGSRGWLRKPAFFPDKVPHAKLFIIPRSPAHIYYAEHHPDDDPNTFKNIMEKNKLTGIHLEISQEY